MMRRVSKFLTMIVAAPLMLQAQAPSPASCNINANNWFNVAYKAARDSAAAPGGKPADVSGLFAMRTARTKACAAKFNLATTTGADLLPLSTLYSSIGMDSLARVAVNKRLAEPGLGEGD